MVVYALIQHSRQKRAGVDQASCGYSDPVTHTHTPRNEWSYLDFHIGLFLFACLFESCQHLVAANASFYTLPPVDVSLPLVNVPSHIFPFHYELAFLKSEKCTCVISFAPGSLPSAVRAFQSPLRDRLGTAES